MARCFHFFCFIFVLFTLHLQADPLYLRNHLKRAEQGDYIVTACDKNFTLMLVTEVTPKYIGISEITIPENRVALRQHSWREWLAQKAPHHTSWITYKVDPSSGNIQEMYSRTRQCYLQVGQDSTMMTTLLNLPFVVVPDKERKKRGPTPNPSGSAYWQPRMIIDGQNISGVAFTPFKTRWPQDKSELSGKQILIYLPSDHTAYPAYFPFWMQVSGNVTKAQVRVVDSGKRLVTSHT
ncbi:MAG: hypothetical protein Tsb0021_13900 [Chlamydiales bacterium]